MENKPRYEVGTWDEAECIKIFYNTFISMKIGFVNMIQDVAEKQGNINVDVVTNALSKSKKRIISSKYMTAGMGDGGSCHPRDNIALRHMAKKLDLQYDLFDAIMKTREVQAKNMAKKLVNLANETKLPILLNGVSYKPGVEITDGSYSLLVGHYCLDIGYHCIHVDPLVSPQKGPFSAIVLLAHSELYCFLNDDSIVVDPWRKYKSTKHKVIYYGNTR
jgi:UDPglucose 6-dehydrogenase